MEDMQLIIGEVFSEVQEITEWMTLGVHLNLELPQLKRIEQMHSDPKRHLLEMLDAWLNTIPEASWSDIVRALRKMEQNVLAGNIEAKFINTTTKEEIDECLSKRPRISEPGECADSNDTTQKSVIKEKAVKLNTQHIKELFAQLVLHILQSLETLNTAVEDVCLVVSNFPCSAKHTNIIFFDKHREEIRNAPSLRALFALLGEYEYWNWKNSGLLHALVWTFGTDNLKERMKQYEKEVQAFHINIKLSTLANTAPCDDKTGKRTDFIKLTAKLEKGLPWSDYTMQCVEEFWESFTKEYLLEKYTLFFHNAKPGCVCLTFIIPAAIAPYVIVESQSKSAFLASQDMVKLTVGDQCVYESGNSSKENWSITQAEKPNTDHECLIAEKDLRRDLVQDLVKLKVGEQCAYESDNSSKEKRSITQAGKPNSANSDHECLIAENDSLRDLVQTLQQDNAEQLELITELKAQHRLTVPIPSQSMEGNSDEECVSYNIGNCSHFAWTLNLNGFFYNHIHSHDSNVLQSSYFAAPNGKSHYQVILSPRSYDKWDSRHCSLFLVAHGSDVTFPSRVVLQCRLPGLQGEGDVEQYFQYHGPDLIEQRKEIAPNCFIISGIYSFLSYSFFMKHLNVMPYFQIVVDLSF